jgi:hypothetical protein
MTKKTEARRNPSVETASLAREVFELACIREFSHSGYQLNFGVSRRELCERIRFAILREHKSHLRWQDSGWTYASAFSQAYKESLDAHDTDKGKLAKQ